MRINFPVFVATALSMLPVYVHAAETAGGALPTAPVLSTLPSWQFASTIAGDELYAALKETPTFASLDKEKLGSPVAIRVSHMFGHTSKGTASAIASALLAGGTLGILPAFSNRDLTVTYEILVNGSILLSYQYSKNLTRVFNIHSTDKTHGLGAEGVAWVTGTASQFAADVAHDSKFAELQAEYRYYYVPTTPTAAGVGPSSGGSAP
jgi:hypothetical protein